MTTQIEKGAAPGVVGRRGVECCGGCKYIRFVGHHGLDCTNEARDGNTPLSLDDCCYYFEGADE